MAGSVWGEEARRKARKELGRRCSARRWPWRAERNELGASQPPKQVRPPWPARPGAVANQAGAARDAASQCTGAGEGGHG